MTNEQGDTSLSALCAQFMHGLDDSTRYEHPDENRGGLHYPVHILKNQI